MSKQQVDVYTVLPLKREKGYEAGTYRIIVALGCGALQLRMPDAPDKPRKEQLTLPSEFASRLMDFFDKHYVNSTRDPRTCHVLAATIQGHRDARNENATRSAARNIMKNGIPGDMWLPAGAWGVYGSPSLGAVHSVVGLGVNVGECLQVDSAKGPLSIAQYNLVKDFFALDDRELAFHTLS